MCVPGFTPRFLQLCVFLGWQKADFSLVFSFHLPPRLCLLWVQISPYKDMTRKSWLALKKLVQKLITCKDYLQIKLYSQVLGLGFQHLWGAHD